MKYLVGVLLLGTLAFTNATTSYEQAMRFADTGGMMMFSHASSVNKKDDDNVNKVKKDDDTKDKKPLTAKEEAKKKLDAEYKIAGKTPQ